MVNRVIGVCLAALLVIFSVNTDLWGEDKRKPVKIEGKSVLPLRVLARPFSNIYGEKDEGSQVMKENVPAFQPFYVYTRPSPEDLELESGWYEVGSDNRGTIIGWMKSDDVFEWKQTMCLSYRHPEGRNPVLMFDRKGYLLELVQDQPADRAAKVENLYSAIDTKQIPENFPVKSVEPKKAVDITEQFYLLPILGHETVQIDGREGRLVKLAAVTKAASDARVESDIRTNQNYLEEAVEDKIDVEENKIKDLQIDIVWVMDTTVSMRPYIEKTLEVAKNASQLITKNPDVSESIHFGFWGYRDSAQDIEGIGYTTMNYTPELQNIDQFLQTLSGIEVTTVDSVDYPEDVFSGVNESIINTAWTPGALKYVILVGDAPSHDPNHDWNLSKMTQETLRALADEKSVFLYALHVKDPRAKKFHEKAETQFQTLSQNRGVGTPTYDSVDSNDQEGFVQATEILANSMISLISQAKQGQVYTGGGQEEDAPVGLIRPLAAIGIGTYNNDANLVIDGQMPDQGSGWNGDQCVWWNGTEPAIFIDLGDLYEIQKISVQIDHNDDYLIEVSSDGVQYETFLEISKNLGEIGWGMDTLSSDMDSPDYVQELAVSPKKARSLKISAVGGDNSYSVSEVQVFTAKSADTTVVDKAPEATGGGELGSLEEDVAVGRFLGY